uniref:Uncharacterized protein n=1 Tax=Trypanosoma congolense (strain IL3000) TaxID=1068625 RepID=G0UKT6_TRYCI|nr:conserved hypothetical protein [Trypanosoma congolense IL3000]
MATRSKASNWGLLFDIALSHGESLQTQRLSYAGFMTLLRSANVLGHVTGIYQVFLGALWQHYGTMPTSEDAEGCEENPDCSKLTVDFDGFIAVMNAVCVRCYQTHRLSEMMGENHRANEAVVLCAEDQGNVPNGVVYTMRRFFKPFIRRCVVIKKMIVSLDARKNSWTPYTNQLVIHIIAASARSVVLPLFEKYAEGGRIYRRSFDRMIMDIFPRFSESQRGAARAIFTYDGFTGIHNLMKYVQPGDLRVNQCALELHSFAEALLMLAIVAFSDESGDVHHRPFTAKVWSTFENYYCNFVGAPMVSDPLKDNKYATIAPSFNLVFPSNVPMDSISSFLISGWNLTVDDLPGDIPEPGAGYPPRLLALSEKVCLSPHQPDAEEFLAEGSTSTLGVSCKHFNEALILPEPAEYSLPIYGVQRCTVYVGGVRARAIQRAPNILEVIIPEKLWCFCLDAITVEFTEHGSEGKLELVPKNTVRVEIRDTSDQTVFAAQTVNFVDSTFEQIVTAPQMECLKAAFAQYAEDGLIPIDRFDDATKKLCVLTPSVKQRLPFFTECGQGGMLGDASSEGADCSSEVHGVSFPKFVSAVATSLMQQHGGRDTLPDIPYLLSVGISRLGLKLPSLVEPKGTNCGEFPQVLPKFVQPHNSRIDVPYSNALRKKSSFLRRYSSCEDMLMSLGRERHILRPLPAFPDAAQTLEVVTQFDGGDGLLEKIKKTSSCLQSSFLKEEMVVSKKGLTLD